MTKERTIFGRGVDVKRLGIRIMVVATIKPWRLRSKQRLEGLGKRLAESSEESFNDSEKQQPLLGKKICKMPLHYND